MGDINEQIQKLREHVPDDKTDDELRELIEEAGGDEVGPLALVKIKIGRDGRVAHASRPSPRRLTAHTRSSVAVFRLLFVQAIIQGKIAEWWEASAGAEEGDEGGEEEAGK
jgi:hypothetical protein